MCLSKFKKTFSFFISCLIVSGWYLGAFVKVKKKNLSLFPAWSFPDDILERLSKLKKNLSLFPAWSFPDDILERLSKFKKKNFFFLYFLPDRFRMISWSVCQSLKKNFFFLYFLPDRFRMISWSVCQSLKKTFSFFISCLIVSGWYLGAFVKVKKKNLSLFPAWSFPDDILERLSKFKKKNFFFLYFLPDRFRMISWSVCQSLKKTFSFFISCLIVSGWYLGAFVKV